ncbi:MAG: malonyl-CoA decarboxylase [Geminicoccaceae bacterium]
MARDLSMPTSMVNQLWTSIADAGRDLVRSRIAGRRRGGIEDLCRDLLSTRGEASGAALAREVVESWRAMSEADRLAFYRWLGSDLAVDRKRLGRAIETWREEPSLSHLLALREATEAPRIELFRRMNTAPNGTRTLVQLRADLLRQDTGRDLREVDADLHTLLESWFNPGFLTLERIDWRSPAALLEKLMRYEKVHRIKALEELKRRLAADRRCFAFFHPALPDEPLIFVQVALVQSIADKVQPLLDPAAEVADPKGADTAIFYSISNCQDGLRGVTLGNFLIKAVVADLARELPQIRTWSTLSPIPGFAVWLKEELADGESKALTTADRTILTALADSKWSADEAATARLEKPMTRLCAQYLAREKRGSRPRDPVARFHLGNGARLERLNWLGDISPKGIAESFGMLVNYRYDPASIEKNHEAFAANGEIVMSSAVKSLLPAV